MTLFPINGALGYFSRLPLYVALAITTVALGGCGNPEPFAYVKVKGKVTYEDGTLIPASRIVVSFVSQAPPIDGKTHAPPGRAEVDVKTGEFSVVTSHTYNDGLIRGDHKVLIQGAGTLVPAEYGDPAKTPLMANTNKTPFEFKVRKPGGKKP